MKQELETKTRRSILRRRKCIDILRGRNSGQAVVEYILIVSIAVALVFILKGAFKGMSSFIDNYLGSYTECLMAHGELPTLGVGNETFSDGSGLKEHLSSGYTCNSGFKEFTLAEGRPPVANGNNSSNQASRNASSTNSDGKNSSSSGSSSSGSSSDGKDGDKDRAGRNGGGSASGTSDENQIRSRGRRAADGYASGGDNRSRLIEDGGDEEGAGGGRRRKPRESRIIYRDRARSRAVLGSEAEQLITKSSRSTFKRKPTSRTVAQVENGTAPGPRSGLMKQPPTKRVIAEETQESGWGFGKMLKWLLIIGIVVALVIFFGGQLLNYSNSDS